jgi:spermidine synthase
MHQLPVEVARAASPRGELVLRRRYDGAREVLELRANGVFVMDTAETSSEEALAREALAFVEHPRQVLVGGLGLGFTLRTVLADPRVERCTVVEIEEALVGWLRDGTVPGGPALLGDPRVEVRVADVAEALTGADPAAYDLVLLDVDNGPGYLVHVANAELYRPTFLTATRRVLRPAGAVVVWSAAPEPALLATLGEAYDRAEEVACPVLLQGRSEHYWLYAGHLGPGAPAESE